MATGSETRHGHPGRSALVSGAVVALIAAPSFSAEPLRIYPTLNVRETITDNVALAPDDQRRSDLVTEVIPGLRMTANGARLKLAVNYQLDGIVHARDTSRSEVRHFLDATSSVEAIQRFFFIDFRGNVSQAVLSPFGARPPSNANLTDNRTETRTFEVSPYVRGAISRLADYEVRYRYTDSRTTSGELGRTRVNELSARLTGNTYGRLGWTADVRSQTFHSPGFETSHLDSATVAATYLIDPSVRLTARAGGERQDLIAEDLSKERKSSAVYGAGVEWRPTPRTNAFARWDHRFFGSSWEYGANHRFSTLSFRFVDRRDVATNAERRSSLSTGLAYELIFNALASRIPDPAERAIEAQRLLQQGGIPPELNIPPDFTSSGVFVSRRQEFAIAATRPRNTAVMTVFRNRREQLNQTVGLVDLSSSTATAVVDTGIDLALSHRLTPLSSLAGLGTWQRTTADVPGGRARQWQARLIYTTQLRRDTSFSAELRHVRFDSDTQASDYRENAAVAYVTITF